MTWDIRDCFRPCAETRNVTGPIRGFACPSDHWTTKSTLKPGSLRRTCGFSGSNATLTMTDTKSGVTWLAKLPLRPTRIGLSMMAWWLVCPYARDQTLRNARWQRVELAGDLTATAGDWREWRDLDSDEMSRHLPPFEWVQSMEVSRVAQIVEVYSSERGRRADVRHCVEKSRRRQPAQWLWSRPVGLGRALARSNPWKVDMGPHPCGPQLVLWDKGTVCIWFHAHVETGPEDSTVQRAGRSVIPDVRDLGRKRAAFLKLRDRDKSETREGGLRLTIFRSVSSEDTAETTLMLLTVFLRWRLKLWKSQIRMSRLGTMTIQWRKSYCLSEESTDARCWNSWEHATRISKSLGGPCGQRERDFEFWKTEITQFLTADRYFVNSLTSVVLLTLRISYVGFPVRSTFLIVPVAFTISRLIATRRCGPTDDCCGGSEKSWRTRHENDGSMESLGDRLHDSTLSRPTHPEMFCKHCHSGIKECETVTAGETFVEERSRSNTDPTSNGTSDGKLKHRRRRGENRWLEQDSDGISSTDAGDKKKTTIITTVDPRPDQSECKSWRESDPDQFVLPWKDLSESDDRNKEQIASTGLPPRCWQRKVDARGRRGRRDCSTKQKNTEVKAVSLHYADKTGGNRTILEGKKGEDFEPMTFRDPLWWWSSVPCSFFVRMESELQNDVTHPVSHRRLRRDITNWSVLGCLMCVSSVSWSVTRCRRRPLRSSDQPCTVTTRAAIKLVRQCHQFDVPRVMDDITVGGAFKDARCTENDLRLLCFRHKMTETSYCFSSPDAWTLNIMRCHGHGRYTFSEWMTHTTRRLRPCSSMLTYPQRNKTLPIQLHWMNKVYNSSLSVLFIDTDVPTERQVLPDETDKQTCNSAFGTHPHRPNEENMLWLAHATGEMTRPAARSLLHAGLQLRHQDDLVLQSHKPCQDVMRYRSLKSTSVESHWIFSFDKKNQQKTVTANISWSASRMRRQRKKKNHVLIIEHRKDCIWIKMNRNIFHVI